MIAKTQTTIRNMYKENGYVVYRKLIPFNFITGCVFDMAYVASGAARAHGIGAKSFHTSLAEMIGIEGLYASTLSQCAKTASLQQLFLHDRIMGVIKRLGIASPCIPSPPVLNVIANNLRVPGGYFGTAAHQDWPSVQGSLDEVTVWVSFTSTKGNFPLEIIPRSHLKGLLPGKVNGSVLEVKAHESEFVAVECDPGDVIFMSGFLVHRTGKGGDDLRVAASMRYDNASEENFIKRKYPCAQKRNVDRALITPSFPTPQQVAGAYK